MMFDSSYSHNRSPYKAIDWWLIGCYILLVLFGWMNIYASIQSESPESIFEWSHRSGKQFVWICTSLVLIATILFAIPPRVYEPVAPIIYGLTLVLLVAVIFFGDDVKGSHSWFSLGPVKFQPAEISKIATSLMLAMYMSRNGFRMKGRDFWITAAIVLVPMLIIIMEKETGSALVYIGFIFVLYREGLSGWLIAIVGLVILLFILTLVASPFISIFVLLSIISFMDSAFNNELKLWFIIGIPIIIVNFFIPESVHMGVIIGECVIYAGVSLWRLLMQARQQFRLATLAVLLGGLLLVFSTNFVFDHVLKDYQRARIEVLLGIREDDAGVGYNVRQSKIAIGSGGWTGKGYCQGTQTAYGFVPEQSTDFIFCTVGEEWGFLGCLFVIGLYLTMIIRIIIDCERSRSAFTRIYGYGLASCIFMHLFINIGMTLGLMPVIGIPLPFMSYGGSSMWAFTIMLFIFISLNRNERKYF